MARPLSVANIGVNQLQKEEDFELGVSHVSD